MTDNVYVLISTDDNQIHAIYTELDQAQKDLHFINGLSPYQYTLETYTQTLLNRFEREEK